MASFWRDTTTLVTGGAGFLGSAIVERLAALDCGDIVVPRSTDHDLRNGDVATEYFASVKPDVVIHLAARVGGIGANQARPAELYLDNLLLGTSVIEAARLAEVAKTVVVGTICSYPKFTPVPFREESLWTGFPEETNAPYGIAKLAQLVHLQANRDQYGQRGVYLMPTNLYGPGDKFHPDVSHVIPALIKKCVEARNAGAESISVWGSGSASREFLYVDDAARGVVAAAEHYDGPEPVNLGANDEIAIKALVELIANLVGFSGHIEWDSTRPDGQPRRCVDASRAHEAFGFTAETSFVDGLRRTIDWYEANPAQAESALI